jgi:hypothetical protein
MEIKPLAKNHRHRWFFLFAKTQQNFVLSIFNFQFSTLYFCHLSHKIGGSSHKEAAVSEKSATLRLAQEFPNQSGVRTRM